jgi:transcriptional antiterminator
VKLELLERRRELVKELSLGAPLVAVVKVLAQKFGVTTRTIRYDYAKRKHWLPILLEISDPHTFFMDLLADHKELKRLSTLEFLQADNSNAKIGALRLLRDLNMDLIELVSLHDVNVRLERMENQQ